MTGLVLEGGGAKGAYQVGAVKALHEMGYEFEGITGTSVGAINGSFIAQGKLDKVYDIWYNAKPSMIFECDEDVLEKLFEFEMKKENFQEILNYLIEVINDHGLDITPLRSLLQEEINEEKIRKNEKDFGLVTFCLTDMKPVEVFVDDVPEGLLIEYIIASSALPIFKIHKIKNKIYIDGGFYDNLPINLLASKGYKDIITIETKGVGRKREIEYDDLNITRITPSNKISKTIEVDTKVMRRNLKIGYLDAYKKIKNYYGEDFYINTKIEDSYFEDFFSNLNKSKKMEISKFFGYKEDVVILKILPIIAEILGLEKKFTNKELLIALNEYMAHQIEIEKLKIYEFRSFEEEIKNKFDFDMDSSLSKRFNSIPLLKLITFNYELVIKNLKDEILKNFYRIVYY